MTNYNVVILPVVTYLDIPVERVLDGAKKAGLEGVVVIGYKKDEEFYFSSSSSSGPEVVWLLEHAKKRLLEVGT